MSRTASLFVAGLLMAPGAGAQELPEGSTGIASRYPGDAGIQSDPSVIFAEDFERSLRRIRRAWDEDRNRGGMSHSSDVPPPSRGERSLLMRKPSDDGSAGPSLYKSLVPRRSASGYDRVFVRTYVKIAGSSDAIRHMGPALGGHDPPLRYPRVRAGRRPSGDGSFWTEVEPTDDAWRWDFYSYWVDMRSFESEDGSGDVTWGNTFLRDTREGRWQPIGPEVERDRWVALEVMVTLNDVGEANGEQAFWIDGELVRRKGQIVSHLGPGFPRGEWIRDRWMPFPEGQPFQGFRWRTTEDLMINYVWLYVYTEEDEYDITVRFDDLVVATEYIGPITPVVTGSSRH